MQQTVSFTKNGEALIRTSKGMYVMRKFEIQLERRTHYTRDRWGRSKKVSVLRRLLVGKAELWVEDLARAIAHTMTVVLETLTLDGVLSVVRKVIKTVLPNWLVFRFKVGGLLDLAFGAGLT